jgi:hypothetical protein
MPLPVTRCPGDAVRSVGAQELDWGQRTRWMIDRQVLEPRLTARISIAFRHDLDPRAYAGKVRHEPES